MKGESKMQGKKLERNIAYVAKSDSYLVNVGRFKTVSFPTLEEARRYIEAYRRETADLKIAKMRAAVREGEKAELAKLKKEAFPYNLMDDAGVACAEEDVDEALRRLSKQEWNFVVGYYSWGLSMEEVGRANGVSKARASQVVAKALRHIGVLIGTLIPAERRRAEDERIRAEESAKLEEWRGRVLAEFAESHAYGPEQELMFGKVEPRMVGPKTGEWPMAGKTVDDLDLSIRTYNCLRRCGKTDVEEILAMTADDVRRIRNLGRKSARELAERLKAMGCEPPWYADFA